METTANQEVIRKRRQHRTPLSFVGDLFNSIWLGVILATLLFFYCSIGSAVPAVRQLPSLEMTEFAWFHWWPFNVLIVLFCVNLCVVTIRRVPFRLVNLGIWTTHAGILLLVGGSYYYFGTKVEGDTPVFRRQVQIQVPGAEHKAHLVVLPGAQTQVTVGSDQWHFQIQSTNNAWPILSKEHAGEKAYAVNVAVTPPHGPPFIRQLLDGYPQYIEDILPGKGRAIKSLGRKLVVEDLRLTLDYQPQKFFHVMDTWALYIRRVGETQWWQRPISGLPRYHDRIASREQVFTDPHYVDPLNPIDLDVPASTSTDPLEEASVRITGYLRHARIERRWHDGGNRLNPVLQLAFLPSHAPKQSYELVAQDRIHSQAENGLVQFRWLGDTAQVATLPTTARALLHVEVPADNIALDVPIHRDVVVGDQGPFTPIENTRFSYRIRNVQDHLSLPGQTSNVSIAMVDIETPEGRIRRWVADVARFTRDLHGESSDPHSVEAKKPDDRIRMTYQPSSAPIVIAAHPGGIEYVFNGPQGEHQRRPIQVGELVEVVDGLSLRVEAIFLHAVSEVKPYIVPPSRRQRDAKESFAMVRLEVNTGHGMQSGWVPFNHYALPGEQYAYAGRFSYQPVRFRGPDGKPVEVLFSRERRKLPHPVALDDFSLDTHVGGYTGAVHTIRNYESTLRFFDHERWTKPVTIAVNAPTENGGFWYFQSTWDKPSPGDPGGGMNYTGLGAGNRNGVHVQLAGCCLAVMGMIFSFYVKPLLKRRRQEQSRSRVSFVERQETGPEIQTLRVGETPAAEMEAVRE